ncbi:MAG: class I SAM-dependent methyltransferase [Thermodesulfobacteriota bacterium]
MRTLKKALLSQHIDIKNKTICDIGCGTGFFVDFYCLKGARDIFGVDITNISIENLKREYPEYHFIKEDVSSNSLLSEISCKFDILNVFDVLYHIMDDKAFELAIANICNLTKHNGFIFISDLFGSKSINVAEHVRLRSREIYAAALEENSANILAIYPLFYLMNRPVIRMIKPIRSPKIGMILDNLFAPIFYYLDGFFLSATRNKLNLVVAKVEKP